jgi:hypothetical protein
LIDVPLYDGETVKPVITAVFAYVPFGKSVGDVACKGIKRFVEPFGGDTAQGPVKIAYYAVKIYAEYKAAFIHISFPLK